MSGVLLCLLLITHSITTLEEVCFEDEIADSNGGMTHGSVTGDTLGPASFAPRCPQQSSCANTPTLKQLFQDDSSGKHLGQVPGIVSLSAQVPDDSLSGGSGVVKSWFVEVEYEGGDHSLVTDWQAREVERQSRIAQDESTPWCQDPMSYVHGKDVFYVDPVNGDDESTGLSLSQAFQTVQKCVDSLHGSPSGSECMLRGGKYPIENSSYILIEHLRGERGKPYVVGKYAGDTADVVFEGTVNVHSHCSKINGPWDVVTADFANGGAGAEHWATTLPADIEPWQLFVGEWGVEGEMFVNARWPNGEHNGRWDDKSMFWSRTWKGGDASR
jgi:hypothetical protein